VTFSATARASAFAQDTGEAWLTLARLSHPSWPEAVAIVDNNEAVTSNGVEHVGFPFGFAAVNENDAPPIAKMQIDNVSTQIAQRMLAIDTPPTVAVELVLASEPDTVLYALPDMRLEDIRIDALTVSGTLRFEDLRRKRLGRLYFVPGAFKGLF